MYADYSIELGHDDPVLELPWRSEDGTCCYQDLKTEPSLIDRVPEAMQYPEMRRQLLRLNASNCSLQTAKCDVWKTQELAPEDDIFNAAWKQSSYIDLLFVKPEQRLNLPLHEEFARRLCTLLARAPELSASIELVIRRCHYWNSSSQTTPPRATPASSSLLEPKLSADRTPSGTAASAGDVVEGVGCGTAGGVTCTPSDRVSADPEIMVVSDPETGPDTTAGFYFTVYANGFGTTESGAGRQWAIASELVTNALLQAATADESHARG